MANFLLVHGAFFGAWCWRRVVPRLQLRGHDVYAVTFLVRPQFNSNVRYDAVIQISQVVPQFNKQE